MRKVLLLDYDHTLYPSTLATLKAVDDRINLYIQSHLGMSPEAADGVRLRMCDEYGTTLRGLEIHHGVNRDHYCDYIHAIEEAFLPPPDPALRGWLEKLPHPVYLFTNARRDWAVRGLVSMGLESFLPGRSGAGNGFREIFDITFMDWQGKPHPQAYAKVESRLRASHGENLSIHFADDRPDNLQAARERNWITIWITPPGSQGQDGLPAFDRVVPSLTWLDPEGLV